MTLSPSLVIRIVPDNGSAVDWTVNPGITFRDVLVCKLVFSRIKPLIIDKLFSISF